MIYSNEKNVKEIEKGLLESNDCEALIVFVIEFYKNKICNENNYIEILLALIVNFKGLTMEEIA